MTLEDLASRIEALEKRRERGGGAAAVDPQCTSEVPHPDLVFMRGPNLYVCRCGKRYMKNGSVLRDE